MMYRMHVMRTDDGTGAPFALVLGKYPTYIFGGTETRETQVATYEEVARHDTYALVDYWATMYNIGKATIKQCQESLSKGFEGVVNDPKSRADYVEGRYGGLDDLETHRQPD